MLNVTMQNFQTSNHKLAVEILRYKRPVIQREQKFCEFCNRDEVEDENRIIFSCKTYKDIRETFFSKTTLTSKYQL